jgi:hypothetical protein
MKKQRRPVFPREIFGMQELRRKGIPFELFNPRVAEVLRIFEEYCSLDHPRNVSPFLLHGSLVLNFNVPSKKLDRKSIAEMLKLIRYYRNIRITKIPGAQYLYKVTWQYESSK